MKIDESEEQRLNAFEPICASVEPDSNVIFERLVQRAKQSGPTVSTDRRISIDASASQFRNALWAMQKSFEPKSNVIFKSALHDAKHQAGTIPIPEGSAIDESDGHPSNAERPRNDSLEFDSKQTVVRF
jgi:hypothetical protein